MAHPSLRVEAAPGAITEKTVVSLPILWAILASVMIGSGVAVKVMIGLTTMEDRIAHLELETRRITCKIDPTDVVCNDRGSP